MPGATQTDIPHLLGTITLKPTNVDFDQVDFPVLLNLSEFSLSLNSINIKNLVLQDSNNTRLFSEIEVFIEDDHALFVTTRVPLVSSSVDTVISIVYYTSYTGATFTAHTQDENSSNVWSNNYIGVYHLWNNTTHSKDARDSTSNLFDGSPHSVVPTSEGFALGGQRFTGGSDSKIVLPSVLPLGASAKTIEVFTKFPTALELSNSSYDHEKALIGCGGTGSGESFSLYVTPTGFRLGGDSTTTVDINYTGHEGQLGYLSLSYDGSTRILNLNGNDIYSDSVSLNSLGNLVIGGVPWQYQNNYISTISEVRVSSVARSTAWKKATYYSILNSLGTSSSTTTYTDTRVHSSETNVLIEASPTLAKAHFLTQEVLVGRIPTVGVHNISSDLAIAMLTGTRVVDSSAEVVYKQLTDAKIYNANVEAAYKLRTKAKFFNSFIELATIKAPLAARLTNSTLEVITEVTEPPARLTSYSTELIIKRPPNNLRLTNNVLETLIRAKAGANLTNSVLEYIVSYPFIRSTHSSLEYLVSIPNPSFVTSVSKEIIIPAPTRVNITYECLEIIASVNSLISGRVCDEYGFPLAKLIRLYKISDDSLVAETNSSSISGHYEFVVDKNTEFYVIAGNINDEEVAIKYGILSV